MYTAVLQEYNINNYCSVDLKYIATYFNLYAWSHHIIFYRREYEEYIITVCAESLSRRGVNLALRRNLHLCAAAGEVFVAFHHNVTMYRFKNRLDIKTRIFKKKITQVAKVT